MFSSPVCDEWVRVGEVGYTSTMPYKLLCNNQLRVIKPLAREVVRFRMQWWWWARAERAAHAAVAEWSGRIADTRSHQAR